MFTWHFDASGDVMIEIFKNKIIISNLGGLVSWLHPKDFGKYSRCRNSLIASMLMRTAYVEKMGTGVRRINQAMDDASLSSVGFDYDEHNFSTTLVSDSEMAGEKGDALNGALNKEFFALIQTSPGIQRKDLVERTGVSGRSADRCIAELVSEGQIERRVAKKRVDIGRFDASGWKANE